MNTASTGGSSGVDRSGPVVARCGWSRVDRVVVAAPAGQPDEVDIRVAGQQPDQLGADIPGRPDDPDADPARPAGRVDAALGARQLAGGRGDRLGRRSSSHDYTVSDA